MKTWFVTGSSRGLGREYVRAALDRGDCVAATARDASSLDDLRGAYGERVLCLPLDVTDRAATFAAVEQAHRHFGRLDVVVNNAGFGVLGMVEELSEAELRGQLETNFFGAVWVAQAAVPLLRAQGGGGRLLQMSSVGGVVSSPFLGAYAASKWALEGLSQALAQEVAEFGIAVTLVELGGYATEADARAIMTTPKPAYDGLRARIAASGRLQNQGEPAAAARVLLELADADDPPLRVLFGEGGLTAITAEYEQRLATWRKWEPLSVSAHH